MHIRQLAIILGQVNGGAQAVHVNQAFHKGETFSRRNLGVNAGPLPAAVGLMTTVVLLSFLETLERNIHVGIACW